MTDSQQITRLLLAYAEHLDAGDFASVGALFDHATYRTAGTDYALTGATEVRSTQEAVVRLYDGVPRTHHNITNITVDADTDEGGESATSRCYFTVIQAIPDDEIRIIAIGRYHDTFEKVDGVWRFSERIIHLDHMADMSAHLRLDGIDLS